MRAFTDCIAEPHMPPRVRLRAGGLYLDNLQLAKGAHGHWVSKGDPGHELTRLWY